MIQHGLADRSWFAGRRGLALLCVAVLVLLVLVLVLARLVDRPYSYFTRDPLQVLGGAPIYIGLLSNLGILLWAGAAAACFVAGETLRRLREPGSQLLFASGALSTLLVLDDMFIMHERSHAAGVPQVVVGLGYAVVLGVFVFAYRDALRASDWPLVVAAAGFFAFSIFLDWYAEVSGTGLRYDGIEDAAKFVGVVLWTAYFGRLAVLALTGALTARRPAG